MHPINRNYLPPVRHDTYNTLRLLNKSFKQAADRALEYRHPGFFLIKTIREANLEAVELADALFDEERNQYSLEDRIEDLKKRSRPLSQPSLPRLKLSSFKKTLTGVPRGVKKGGRKLTEITSLPLTLYKKRGANKKMVQLESKIEDLREEFLEACATREEYTPILKLYEMEQFVIKLVGGNRIFSSLPHFSLSIDLLRAPLPKEVFNAPVSTCQDAYGRFFITMNIPVVIDIRFPVTTSFVQIYFLRSNRWVYRRHSDNVSLLGQLAIALTFLFDYKNASINPYCYPLCLKFLPKIATGKNLSFKELHETKLPRPSDLRLISLVAKNTIST